MEPNDAMPAAAPRDATESQGRVLVVALLALATVAFVLEFFLAAGSNGVDLVAVGLALLSGALLFERLTAPTR